MAVTAKMYGKAMLSAFAGKLDWENDTIKVALCSADYTPNQDTHQFFSDVTNELSTGGGYTKGGMALGNKTATYAADTNTTKLDAADLEILTATFDARYGIIFNDTPQLAADKPLMGYVDFGETLSPRNGPFKIAWNEDGIFVLSVS